MFCYSLPWWLVDWIFPVRIPAGRNLPGELGRIGTATGAEAIFAKGCFSSRVAGWSPKTEDRPRFLVDCFALLEFVSWSVNPQVVGSSPTRGAMKKSKPMAWIFSVKSVLSDGINPSSMDEIPPGDEIRLRREIRTDLISSKPPAWISSASADFILA